MQQMKKVKDYFERYPNSNEVFENGGKLFHTRGAADSFGKGETKRHTRAEVANPAKEKVETSKEEE